MVISSLGDLVRHTPEFQTLSELGASLRAMSTITTNGKQIADHICAMVPDELIEKHGVERETRSSSIGRCQQFRICRGYEVHLFPSGNKHLLSNDGADRYLNADYTAEVSWCGPPPGSILLFSLDLNTGLVEEVEEFVGSFAGQYQDPYGRI